MLVPKGLSSKKVFLLGIILIVTLGAIFYLVYTNFLSGNKTSAELASEAQTFNFDIVIPEAKGFDVKFFENPMVRTLKSYASLPLTVGQVGQTDLFGPSVTSPAAGRH